MNAEFEPQGKDILPRLALQQFLAPDLENAEWYGRGPIENYQDRKDAAFLGIYDTTVSDMKEYYGRGMYTLLSFEEACGAVGGPGPLPEYSIQKDKKYSYSFVISPTAR